MKRPRLPKSFRRLLVLLGRESVGRGQRPAGPLWACVLLLILIGLPEAAPARPTGSASSYYDSALYHAAMESLDRGQYDSSAESFCKMLRPPARGELWTLSVVLLCDPSQLAEEMAKLERPSPVFVQIRYFEGRRCYRVCAGLTTSRAEASRWAAWMPQSLRTHGPFPVRVEISCEDQASGMSATSAASPKPAPEQPPRKETEPTPPQTPIEPEKGKGHSAFLGPPVKVQATPPTASSNEGEAWFQKGLEAYRKGDRLEAYEDYNRALEIEPGRPEVLNNLGVLYLEEKQYAKARDLFQQVVEKSPGYARCHLNLAGALWGLGNRDEAIQEARTAVELDQRDVNAHLTLASFFLATDRKEEAADQAKRALLLEPGNAQAEVFLKAATAPPEPAKAAP